MNSPKENSLRGIISQYPCLTYEKDGSVLVHVEKDKAHQLVASDERRRQNSEEMSKAIREIYAEAKRQGYKP